MSSAWPAVLLCDINSAAPARHLFKAMNASDETLVLVECSWWNANKWCGEYINICILSMAIIRLILLFVCRAWFAMCLHKIYHMHVYVCMYGCIWLCLCSFIGNFNELKWWSLSLNGCQCDAIMFVCCNSWWLSVSVYVHICIHVVCIYVSLYDFAIEMIYEVNSELKNLRNVKLKGKCITCAAYMHKGWCKLLFEMKIKINEYSLSKIKHIFKHLEFLAI